MTIPCLCPLFLVLLLLLVPFPTATRSRRGNSMQCIDDEQRTVDWYILLKLPQIQGASRKLFNGHRYATISSRQTQGWRLSDHQIDNADRSILANTLRKVYEQKKKNLSFTFYNDQNEAINGSHQVENETSEALSVVERGNLSNYTSSGFAHAKGILASDGRKGFWLIHTIPQFAPSHEFTYPKTGLRYGQVALCISLRATELAKVVNSMLIIKPLVYAIQIAEKPKSLSKALTKLKNGQWHTEEKYLQLKWTSLADLELRSFFKSRKDVVDLYSAIVAPALNSSLLVETWRKGNGDPLPSECSYPKVENVEQVKVTFVNTNETGSFDYRDDHSKWAVSEEMSKQKIICVGDINRMASQYRRGGGTTCFEFYEAWKAFNGLVGKSEQCQ